MEVVLIVERDELNLLERINGDRDFTSNMNQRTIQKLTVWLKNCIYNATMHTTSKMFHML